MNKNRSPLLVPYPNYEVNRLPNGKERAADRIISLFRMSVDSCNRLWAIDMGVANGTRHSEPRLIVIDLNTDRIVRRFTITSNLRRADNSTWFVGLIADVDPKSCDKSFAYLADIGWGLVVYNFHDNSAWRLDHPYFYFDPLSTAFIVGGVRVQWKDGIFGLTLSERHADGFRTLYFSVMASTRMFSVNTRVLQSNRSVADTLDEYKFLGHRPVGMQASALSMNEVTGAMFYPLVNQDAIGCWNPRRSEKHSAETTAVVAQDSMTLVYPSDVKVDSESNLWVISDRMPLFLYQVHNMKMTDINYRVFKAPVTDLIKDTVCEPTKYSGTFNSGYNKGYNTAPNYGYGGFNSNTSPLTTRPRLS